MLFYLKYFDYAQNTDQFLKIRLLELVADDAALEDTIYHLGRGLNSETANIDLDQFLKVRISSISRILYSLTASLVFYFIV